MEPTIINRCLPKGFFAVFIEAEDMSVDDEFEVHGPNGKTSVSVQVGAGDFCVNRIEDAEKFTMRFWPPRQYRQAAALTKDLAQALVR